MSVVPISEPRFTGLARSSFTRSEDTIEVRYEGRGVFDEVRGHYLRGFTTAGYAQEVMDSTPAAESHRFTANHEIIGLLLLRQAEGRVGVRLKALTR